MSRGTNIFRGFVNAELNKELTKEAKAIIDNPEQLREYANALVVAGYDLKITYDESKQGFRCIVFGATGTPDAGYAVGSIAGSVEKALGAVMIKATRALTLGAWKESYQEFAFDL